MKSLKKRISEWLFFAQDDLRFAEIALKEEVYHHACFNAHQCIEKTFKAFLVDSKTSPPKTHDLGKLLQKIKDKHPVFLECLTEIKQVNKFYISTRYPDAFPGSLPEGLPTKEDAEKAVEVARKIFEKGKIILSKTLTL